MADEKDKLRVLHGGRYGQPQAPKRWPSLPKTEWIPGEEWLATRERDENGVWRRKTSIEKKA